MEYNQTQRSGTLAQCCRNVLILVLMEYNQTLYYEKSYFVTSRLNPCFNGIQSNVIVLLSAIFSSVLILVLMEYNQTICKRASYN